MTMELYGDIRRQSTGKLDSNVAALIGRRKRGGRGTRPPIEKSGGTSPQILGYFGMFFHDMYLNFALSNI